MMADQADDPPATPLAPPVRPTGPPIPARRSDWPGVLGVIAIVLASLGILGACWGIAASLLLDAAFPGSFLFGVGAPVTTAAWQVWLALSQAATGIVAGLLLAAGIGLVRRRRWGVRASCCWAILKMIVVVLWTAVSYGAQQAQFRQTALSNPGMPVPPTGLVTIAMLVGVGFTILWGWALPVFMLIWFSRGRIKNEVAEWE